MNKIIKFGLFPQCLSASVVKTLVFAAFAIFLPLFSGCASAPGPATMKPESTLSAAPITGEKDAEIEKIRSSVTEELKKSLRDQVKSEVREEMAREMGKVEMSAAAPEWAKRVRFGGDMRLRQDNDRSDKIRNDYAPSANPSTNYAALPDQMHVQQHGQGPADNSIAALVDLLKRKNVLNSDEAARFTEQFAADAAGVGKDGASASDSVSALVALLQSKNVLSADEAARFAGQSVAPAARGMGTAIASETEDKITANVTQEVMKALPEQVKNEVQATLPAEISKEKADLLAALPEWTKRIRLAGDIRLRYESDRFDKHNDTNFALPSNPTQLANVTVNQDFYKYRVRFGPDIKVNDDMDAVIRLSTGNTGTPVSTNDILGNFMNKDNVLFDLAYVKWKLWDFLSISGGRMPNPWFSTDLLWSRDLNFEGFAATAKQPIVESWSTFLTGGAFPLQHPVTFNSQRGKWLEAGQIGIERQSQKGVAPKLAVAYYNFVNITGVRNDPLHPGLTDWSAPLFQQKGNTVFDISADQSGKFALASEFKEFNITGSIDIGFWDPVHITLDGDFVKNFGFNKSDVAQLTGFSDPIRSIVGYQVGMTVGYPTPEAFAQWKAYVHYKWIGNDAVVDAFTDSDFHLGGTNAKGWVLGGDFGVAKNAWITLKWLTADQLNGPQEAIDVFQADFNVRF